MPLFLRNRIIEEIAPFSASGLTVSVVYYDEATNASTGTATEIGITGNYKYSFTPDNNGDWRLVMYSGSEKHTFHYIVQDYVDTTATVALTGVTEKTIFEVTKYGIYNLSAFIDVNAITTAGVITLKLYNQIDGTNYRIIARTDFIVGTSTEHPNFEINALHDYTKLTITCSNACTESVIYRYIAWDLGTVGWV
jgi:hypothetical protein